MVLRVDTECPRCGKKNAVFNRDKYCDDCKLRGYYKSAIKHKIRLRKIMKELYSMSDEKRVELHNKIMKELEEEDKNG